ncbi:hypothetical protein OESDEN_07190 [Oesophagostomum dentatum]|uniref:Uncharacterized protein n=1 Tax=Oesophagostomum dentatum TaxID=61180 RepID=A0A0B1TAR3_OESDE|nr:hypothetical protein OESDEN_07190 [Oesophagostomum dentatum]
MMLAKLGKKIWLTMKASNCRSGLIELTWKSMDPKLVLQIKRT